MKFECGESREERRARKFAERKLVQIKEARRMRTWHTYFALWPRRVAPGDCRWLEYIERRVPSAYAGWDCFEESFLVFYGDKPVEFRAKA